MYRGSSARGVISASARSRRSSCRRWRLSVIASIAPWAFTGRERRSLSLRAALQLAAQRGDLDDGRADVGVARGEDLLAQVRHIGGVVAQRSAERERTLVLEEVEVLLDVAG